MQGAVGTVDATSVRCARKGEMGYGSEAQALVCVQPRARRGQAEGTTGEDEGAVVRWRGHARAGAGTGGLAGGRGGAGAGAGAGAGTLEVSSGWGWGSYINRKHTHKSCGYLFLCRLQRHGEIHFYESRRGAKGRAPRAGRATRGALPLWAMAFHSFCHLGFVRGFRLFRATGSANRIVTPTLQRSKCTQQANVFKGFHKPNVIEANKPNAYEKRISPRCLVHARSAPPQLGASPLL